MAGISAEHCVSLILQHIGGIPLKPTSTALVEGSPVTKQLGGVATSIPGVEMMSGALNGLSTESMLPNVFQNPVGNLSAGLNTSLTSQISNLESTFVETVSSINPETGLETITRQVKAEYPNISLDQIDNLKSQMQTCSANIPAYQDFTDKMSGVKVPSNATVNDFGFQQVATVTSSYESVAANIPEELDQRVGGLSNSITNHLNTITSPLYQEENLTTTKTSVDSVVDNLIKANAVGPSAVSATYANTSNSLNIGNDAIVNSVSNSKSVMNTFISGMTGVGYIATVAGTTSSAQTAPIANSLVEKVTKPVPLQQIKDSIPQYQTASAPTAAVALPGTTSTSTQVKSADNAYAATKLEAARLITLAGDVSGSTTFDGSENVTIDVAIEKVADSSYVNKLVNGDFQSNQREFTSVALLQGIGLTWLADQWACISNVSDIFSAERVTHSSSSEGITYSLKFTSVGVNVPSSNQYHFLHSGIEGYDFAEMMWGTALALPITLSFKVRSSITGTHGGSIRGASDTLAYAFTYTVNQANAWEYKTITIPGCTTGSWNSTNGSAINISFNLAIGSNRLTSPNVWTAYPSSAALSATGCVDISSVSGATWEIAEIQINKGSKPAPFEKLPYQLNLQRCWRYIQKVYFNEHDFPLFLTYINGDTRGSLKFIIPMRATPSVTTSHYMFRVIAHGNAGEAVNAIVRAGAFYTSKTGVHIGVDNYNDIFTGCGNMATWGCNVYQNSYTDYNDYSTDFWMLVSAEM